MKPTLYIGNRNYSSWSLRAWLILEWSRADFDTISINLDQPGYGESQIKEVLSVSPSGKVPSLHESGEQFWDTLGIAHWACEQPGGRALLPTEIHARILMWSAIGEMHSGFGALRHEFPMNLRRRCVAHGYSRAAQNDVARVDALWKNLLGRFGGPYLMGDRTLLDAFFLPVATRFRTYGIDLSAVSQAYTNHILEDASFTAWEADARKEGDKTFARADTDRLYSNPAETHQPSHSADSINTKPGRIKSP